MRHDCLSLPGGCPAAIAGHVPDLETAPFALRVDDVTRNAAGEHTETGILASFGESMNGGYPDVVEGYTVVPHGSEVALAAHRVARSDPSRVRDLLLERILRCRGAVGVQCPALGECALTEVILEADAAIHGSSTPAPPPQTA